LKVLLTVVNTIGARQQKIPEKITALARKSERKRIEIEDMKKLLLSITGNAMEAYAERIAKASDILDGVILLGEFLTYKKARMAEDNARARARIVQLAPVLSLDYDALVRAEAQIVNGGVFAVDRTACDGDIGKSAAAAQETAALLIKSLPEKMEREKIFYNERAKMVNQFVESNEKKFVESDVQKEKETAFIRMEFMEQLRRMEENRREFYAHFESETKRLPREDYTSQQAPAAADTGMSVGGNKLLLNETVLLSDGALLDAMGEIVAEAPKLSDEREEDLLRAKMAERQARATRQYSVLRSGGKGAEKENIDQAVLRIERQFRSAV
jgi:hypothetical protein